MNSEELGRAVQLIKAGNKQAALPILKQIIQSEPGNESAWTWLFSCVDDLAQKKFILKKILQINPNHFNALGMLERLNSLDAPLHPDQPLPATREPATQPRSATPTPAPAAAAPLPPRPAPPPMPQRMPITSTPVAPAPHKNVVSQQETVYYQKDQVLVTSHRVVFGADTHVLRNITSVGLGKIPAKRAPGRIIAVVAFLIGLCGSILSFEKTQPTTLSYVSEAICSIGVILGLVLSFTAKPRHVVVLESGSAHANGYASKDLNEVQSIINTINQALVEKG